MSYKETLLTPVQIGTKTCKNRFFMQPMECNDEDANGNPSQMTIEGISTWQRARRGWFPLRRSPLPRRVFRVTAS